MAFFSALMEDKVRRPSNLQFAEIVGEAEAIIEVGEDMISIIITQVLVILLKGPKYLNNPRLTLRREGMNSKAILLWLLVDNF